MVTCIILMIANEAFAKTYIGAVITPILAVLLIFTTKGSKKKENNKEAEDFLSKYNFDTSSFDEFKNLNNSYILLKETINKDKENKKALLDKKGNISNSIENFFNNFKSLLGSNEEKLQIIESTYLLLDNELETLSNLEKNKSEFTSKYNLNDNIVEVSDDIINQLTNKLDEIDSLINELEKQKVTLINHKDNLLKENEVLDELEKQLLEATIEKDRLSYRYNVLTNTKELLTKSSELLQAKYVKPMKDAISKYFNLTLKDKEKEFSINTDFEINIVEHGKNKEISYYSKGYQQLVSLCMRLALIDCLYENEKPFIILDDPFINLDDERLKDCFKLIENVSKQMQVIYFTCHSSRTF